MLVIEMIAMVVIIAMIDMVINMAINMEIDMKVEVMLIAMGILFNKFKLFIFKKLFFNSYRDDRYGSRYGSTGYGADRYGDYYRGSIKY